MTVRRRVAVRWVLVILGTFAVVTHGVTKPVVLRVGTVSNGPGVASETAEMVRDYLLSVLAQRSRIVVIDDLFEFAERPAEDPTYDVVHSLTLEGAVWETDDAFYLTMFLYDGDRSSVLMAAAFDVQPDSVSRTMRAVAENVEATVVVQDLLHRLALDETTKLDPVRLLLERGEVLPAWERYLMIHRVDGTANEQLEFRLRELTADELARAMLRERSGTEDPVGAFLELLLVDPAVQPGERPANVMRAERTILDLHAAEHQRRFRYMRREFRRAERRRDPIGTFAVLQSPEFLELSQFFVEDAHELSERHARLAWRSHIRASHALRRRGEFDEAASRLDKAEQAVAGTPEVARAAVRVETARERWIDRQLFLSEQPSWNEPRTVRDRSYHVTFGMGTIADPASRFLVDSFATHLGVGYDQRTPLLPFVRRVVGGQVVAARWNGEQGDLGYQWSSVYPSGYVGVSLGTERVEVTSAVTGGLRMMIGERETIHGADSTAHIAPAVGFQFEAALYVPSLHARVGIVTQTARALWIPPAYPTAMSAVGLRFAWIR